MDTENPKFGFETNQPSLKRAEEEAGDQECPACGNPIRNMSCPVCRERYKSTVEYQKNLTESRNKPGGQPYKPITIEKERPPNDIATIRKKNQPGPRKILPFEPRGLPPEIKKRTADDVRKYKKQFDRIYPHLTEDEKIKMRDMANDEERAAFVQSKINAEKK